MKRNEKGVLSGSSFCCCWLGCFVCGGFRAITLLRSTCSKRATPLLLTPLLLSVLQSWIRSFDRNADVQFNLGDVYDKGQSTHQNDKQAPKWHQEAAAQGQHMPDGAGMTLKVRFSWAYPVSQALAWSYIHHCLFGLLLLEWGTASRVLSSSRSKLPESRGTSHGACSFT